jgi:hypothetical protein
MVKLYGPQIYCQVCHAEPYPDPESGSRESFDLLCLNAEWRCELHRQPREKRASRVAAATPAEALNEFVRALAVQTAYLEEAVAGCDDDDVISAFKEHSEELRRALNALKETITAQAPPRAEKTPQNKRARVKPISAREREHESQGDLIADQKAEDA